MHVPRYTSFILSFALLGMGAAAKEEASWKKSYVLSRAGDAYAHNRFDEAAKLFRSILSFDPNDETALLHLGVMARRSGQFEKAIALLTQGAKANPHSASLQFELGVTLLSNARPDEAVAPLQTAASLNPTRLDALVNLGDALSLSGRRAEARNAYDDALAIDGTSSWAQRQAGYCAFELGLYSKAVEHLRRAQGAFAKEWNISLVLGHALSQLGDHARALEAYERVIAANPGSEQGLLFVGIALERLGRRSDALARLEQAVKLKPTSAPARIHLGNLLKREGLTARARGAYEAALKLEPNNAWALTQLGSLELERGNAPKAVELLQRAIELAPDNIDLGIALGDAFSLSRKYDAAQARFAEVLKQDPTNVAALLKRSAALAQLNRNREALELSERAVAIAPRSVWALISLGDGLRSAGRTQEAKARYQEGLALEPSSVWAQRQLGFLHFELEEDEAALRLLEPLAQGGSEFDVLLILGHLAARRKAFDEAIAFYERAFARDMSQARVLLFMAHTQFLAQRPARARTSLEQALALDESLVDGWVLLGDVERRLAEAEQVAGAKTRIFEEAQKAYQKALALDSDGAYTKRQLGTLSWEMGDFEGAKRWLAQARINFPRDGELTLLWGHLAWREQAVEEAQQAYLEAIELLPRDVRPLVFAGRALLSSDRYEEADALFVRALALEPRSSWAHLERGYGQRQRRDWVGALASAEASTALDPKNPQSWLFLGRLRQERGLVEKAVEAYEWATELEPDSLLAQRALSSALTNRGRVEDLLRAEILLRAPLERLADQGYTFSVAAWTFVKLWNQPESVLPPPNLPDTRELRRGRWAGLARFALSHAVELAPLDEHVRLASAVGLAELKEAGLSRAMVEPLLKPSPQGCPEEEWSWVWNTSGEPSPPAPATTPEEVLALDEAQLRSEAHLLASVLASTFDSEGGGAENANSPENTNGLRVSAMCSLMWMPWRADAHLRLGASYEASGLLRLAEEHFEAALRINPASAEAQASIERLRKEGGMRMGPLRVSGDALFSSDFVPGEVLARQAVTLGFATPALQRALLTTPRAFSAGALTQWEHADWKGRLRVGAGYHFVWGWNTFLNDQLAYEDRQAHLVDMMAQGRYASFQDRRLELTWQAGYRLALAGATTRSEARHGVWGRGRLLQVNWGTLEGDVSYEVGLFTPRAGAVVADTVGHGVNFGIRLSPLLRRWATEVGAGYRASVSVLVPSGRAIVLHEAVVDGRKRWGPWFLGGEVRVGATSDRQQSLLAEGTSVGVFGQFGYTFSGYTQASVRSGVSLVPSAPAFNATVVGARAEHRVAFRGLLGADTGLTVALGYDARISYGLNDVQHLATAAVALGR